MRMRFLFAGFALLGAVSAFGQQSMLNERSFEVLKNELDLAQEASPEFGSLQGLYLFGSLDRKASANGGTGYNPWLGFYLSGDVPMSILVNIDHASPNTAQNTGSTTTLTPDTKTITRTGTPPNEADVFVTWTKKSETKTFNRPVLFNAATTNDRSISDQVRTLFNLTALELPIVTGLSFQYNLSDFDAGTSNYTMVTKEYVDSTALTLTVNPDPKQVREGTNTLTDLDVTTSYSGQIPVAFAFEGLRHKASLGGAWWRTDFSTSRVDTGLKPMYFLTDLLPGTETWTEYNNAKTDTEGGNFYSLSYELSPEAAKDSTAPSAWTFGGYGSLTLPERNYSDSNDNTVWTQTNVGDPATKTGVRTVDGYTYTMASQSRYSLGLNASLGFQIPLAPNLTWSSKPTASIGWDNSLDSKITLSKIVRVEKSDLNGDGDFVDSTETVTTTTTDYTNAATASTGVPSPTGAKTGNDLNVQVVLPVALEYKPAGWPVSFMVAAKATLGVDWKTSKTKGYTEAKTTVTQTGTGTAANTVTTTENGTATTDTSTERLTWTNETDMEFLTRMSLADNVSLDIGLSGGATIFSFESLTLQFTIALPAPKFETPVDEVKPVEPAPVAAAPAAAGPPATVPAPAPVAAPATTTAPTTAKTPAPATTTATKAPATTATKKP